MPGQPSQHRPKCRATTKAGNPCQRHATAGSAYCGVHGGTDAKIGAPRKLDAVLTATIADAVRAGLTWEVAAEAAGIHRDTLRAWRAQGETDLEAGTPSVYADLTVELMCARAAGEERLVRVIRAAAPEDWRAAAFLLERSRPERWARRDAVDAANLENLTAAKPRDVVPVGEKRSSILELLAAVTQPPADTGTT